MTLHTIGAGSHPVRSYAKAGSIVGRPHTFLGMVKDMVVLSMRK
ncbi:MAG: hypothetical protein R3F28_18690 [Candidatus Kapaibacterium sp.]